MSESTWAAVFSLTFAALFGALVPWLAMRALVPALSGGPLQVSNYRGRPVSATLGTVWVVWAITLLLVQTLLDATVAITAGSSAIAGVLGLLGTTPLAMPFLSVPFLVVAGTFAVGMLDDIFGRGGAKGFRGHFSALREGRLTTGMLKLLGIGLLALIYGNGAATAVLARSGIAGDAPQYGWWYVGAWLLSATTIALAANFMNLLDVRPGRALKSYTLLVLVPGVAYVVGAAEAYAAQVGAVAGAGLSDWEVAAAAVAYLVALLGPVVAVWRFDLREEAMLGDGGANVMGAVVGYLLTATLSLAGLAIATGALLAMNMLSERVSFSAVIEKTPLLAALDRIGRRDHGR